MGSAKEAQQYAAPDQGEAPPSYDSQQASSSSQAQAASSQPKSSSVPTIDSPFDFPTDAPLPPYELTSHPESARCIALPQTSPSPTAPFLPAYAPKLLSYGITEESWTSFVKTLTGFLTATVSDRAISHAADVGKQLGGNTTSFFKGLGNHAKDVGSNIATNTKKGNVIGAVSGVIGGLIRLPVHAAVGGAVHVASMPGTAVAALASKPRKPRERAEVYAQAANKKWLSARGLNAVILSSEQLSQQIGAPVLQVAQRGLDSVQSGSQATEAQLKGLEGYLERLELRETGASLQLGAETLWLVLIPVKSEDDGSPGPSSKRS
ncbi:hypothetical protein B0I35DRAFT_437507 [Stachybotrys elegans]|uniref:Uncharacterized protein n=1 Tax=Stachybotrys elegans TaxID=80388 RepID=A0A8K0SSG6_9HYPO|nr:hypothetical protein B0I35DRAFT_437507 [Stachybotrys elegans]